MGLNTAHGAFARLEAGFKPLDNAALFAFGEISSALGGMAGAGFRVTF